MLRTIFLLIFVLLVPFSARAIDLHLVLPETSHSVLSPKTQALTLKQVNELVLNDDIDLQLSYESLIQAEKRIGLARAAYFPYGVGTVAALYFMNIFSPILLVELFTSLPTKIYHVQSEKNMSHAQYYMNEALKENIKNQVAHLYYSILKEESALKLAKMEITLQETLYKATQDKVQLGLATEQDLLALELRMLNLRDICLKFSLYMSEEKAAFNTMLAQATSENKNFELQTVSEFLNPLDFGLSSETLKLNAIDRSPEIVAADYQVNAAYYSKKSTKWSILSFSGIGFGYWSKVQVEGSKVDQARANRELVETTLSNQTYVVNNQFHRSLDHFLSEQGMFDDTASFYQSELGRFMASNIALDRLAEGGIIYLKDFSRLVVAHYDALITLNDLERLALGDVKGSMNDLDLVSLALNDLGNNKVSLTTTASGEIEAVEYVFDSLVLNSMTSENSSSNFAVNVRFFEKEKLCGHANVKMKAGKKITKAFAF